MKIGKERRQWAIGDDGVVDVQAFVEGLVEVPADIVRDSRVQRFRVFNQMQCVTKYCGSKRQLLASARQAGFDVGAFNSQCIQFGPYFVPWHVAVSGQVDETRFFRFDLFEAARQTRVQLSGARLRVAHGLLQSTVYVLDEVVRQQKGCVVGGDGLLDEFDAKVRQVAQLVLASPACEVGVHPAVALALGIDHPRRAACCVAALAIQHSFEVVLMDPVALATGAARVKYLLNAVKRVCCTVR